MFLEAGRHCQRSPMILFIICISFFFSWGTLGTESCDQQGSFLIIELVPFCLQLPCDGHEEEGLHQVILFIGNALGWQILEADSNFLCSWLLAWDHFGCIHNYVSFPKEGRWNCQDMACMAVIIISMVSKQDCCSGEQNPAPAVPWGVPSSIWAMCPYLLHAMGFTVGTDLQLGCKTGTSLSELSGTCPCRQLLLSQQLTFFPFSSCAL